MFKKSKTLDDYIKDYNPYNDIEVLVKPKYIENTASAEHKELEKDIEEYWDLIHPMVADFINSYALTMEKMIKTHQEMENSMTNSRRSLTLEQENVQELNDQVRELKKALASEGVIRRDLEERLRDERASMESHFAQEKKSLELMLEAKVPEGASVEDIIKQISGKMGSSEEAERYKKKIAELEKKIQEEREENEKIQAELSMSFMEKMTKSDEIISNLKARLGEE
jgi:septal ring factor EnvC (AmiA/AmiB activator)